MLLSFIAMSFGGDMNWLQAPALRWSLTSAYFLILAVISLYGLHRYWLVWLYYRNRRRIPVPQATFEKLPPITVQLPMYNEARVAQRIIAAACRLDYPRHLLQIQVLDDSTDESAAIARQCCAEWAARDVAIQYLHRADRRGYKAGALAHALPQATGEFIAIFDADFVPDADFLRRTIDYFTDPAVGMIQTRWDHLNRGDSLLTRCQAIFLDGHFLIEHTSRNCSQRWINFNGTAGLWRRQAIESAGGWHHDTLTEDVDLSYRAQLAGWKFIFLPRVTCPAELPPEINAFKAQQHRWTKGSIQTAKKLLPSLLRADIPLGVKVEAFFHLTSPMVYLYMSLMALLFYPVICVNIQPFEKGSYAGLLLGLSLFALGTVSASVFYVASQKAQGRSYWATAAQIPLLMSIGVGIALNNARGCIEALLGHDSPFIRTPKYNTTAPKTGPSAIRNPQSPISRPLIPTPSIKLWMCLLEIAMGLYMVQCIRLTLRVDNTFVSIPFLTLFAIGYFYVGLTSLWNQIRSRRASRSVAANAV